LATVLCLVHLTAVLASGAFADPSTVSGRRSGVASACRRGTFRLLLRCFIVDLLGPSTRERCVCVTKRRGANQLLCWLLAVTMLLSGFASASSFAVHAHEVGAAVGDVRSALGDICLVNKADDGDMPDKKKRPHCSLGLCCSAPVLSHAPATDLGPSWRNDELFRTWFLCRTDPLPNSETTPVVWARGPPNLA
jgi:hypothetical protein